MQTLSINKEVTQALREVLVSDATLTAWIPVQQIWCGNDLEVTEWPAIAFRILKENPETRLSGPGLWRPLVRLSVTGYEVQKGGIPSVDVIAARVHSLLRLGCKGAITSTVDTTNFRISESNLEDSAFLGNALRLEAKGDKAVTYSHLWRFRVTQRTQGNG